MSRRRSIQFVWLSNAAAMCVGLTLTLRFLIGWHWLPSWFIAANAVAFVLYGWDKRLARTGGIRVPERVLHILAFLGGSAGALAAQRVFRHKTSKRSFQVWFWAICVLQLAALAWWFWPRL